jgi:hypothetical protein
VERDPRAGGEPSYTLTKLFRLAFDGVFAFSVTPLRAAWLFGACASATAFIYAIYAIFQRLFLGTSPQGFTALIVAITFFAGVQLLFLGLIGEYLGRVYDEAKGRPNFVVTDVVRGDGLATEVGLRPTAVQHAIAECHSVRETHSPVRSPSPHRPPNFVHRRTGRDIASNRLPFTRTKQARTRRPI